MSFETNAEHVEYLALQPVGRRPDRNGARYRLGLGIGGFDANTFVVRKGIEDPDHFKWLLPVRIMHGGDVHAIIKFLLIAQDLQQLWNHRRIGDDVFLYELGSGFW